MTQIYCWRCNGPPVKVYGVPCPACRAILNAEYDAKVAANGGRPLYIPVDVPLSKLAASLSTPEAKPTVKNKLTDLNDHLFAQLERLSSEDMTPEQIAAETQRATAIVSVADKVIQNARLQVDVVKLVVEHGDGFKQNLPMIASS